MHKTLITSSIGAQTCGATHRNRMDSVMAKLGSPRHLQKNNGEKTLCDTTGLKKKNDLAFASVKERDSKVKAKEKM